MCVCVCVCVCVRACVRACVCACVCVCVCVLTTQLTIPERTPLISEAVWLFADIAVIVMYRAVTLFTGEKTKLPENPSIARSPVYRKDGHALKIFREVVNSVNVLETVLSGLNSYIYIQVAGLNF